jgi:tetratricopeptide (TPR) repeat protein
MRAAVQFANTEAIGHLGRALELTPESDRAMRYELLLYREQVYDLQGERSAQAADLMALAGLAQDMAQPAYEAEVALRRANYADKTNDYPAVIRAARQAIQLAKAAHVVPSQARGYMMWGIALWRQGVYHLAQSQLKRALKLSREAGVREVEADSLRLIGNVVRAVDKREARTRYQEALDLARTMHDRLGESKALNNLGIIAQDYAMALQRGEEVPEDVPADADPATYFSEAHRYYEQALQLSQEIGDRLGESKVLDNLGTLAQNTGDLERAHRHYEQAQHMSQEARDRQGEAIILSHLAHLLYQMDEGEQARIATERALHLTRAIGNEFIYSIERVPKDDGEVVYVRWAGEHRLR